MYVDESGDTGLINSPTKFFVLSGIVVHESRWRDFINVLIAFRRTLKSVYGLPIRTEIHASHYINHKPVDLPRHVRLAILRNTIDELAKLNFIKITNIVVSKAGKPADYDVFNSEPVNLSTALREYSGSRVECDCLRSLIRGRRRWLATNCSGNFPIDRGRRRRMVGAERRECASRCATRSSCGRWISTA